MITIHRSSRLIGIMERETIAVPFEGRTARELLEAHRDTRLATTSLVPVLNGHALRLGCELDQVVPDDADLALIPDVGFIVFGTTTLAALLLEAAIGAVIATGLGYAINALFPPPEPSQERGEETSPTYAWDGIGTGYGTGTRIPLVYGQVRIGGQVISAGLDELAVGEDVLSMLICLGYGQFAKIAGFEVHTKTEIDDQGDLGRSAKALLLPTGIRVNGNELKTRSDFSLSIRAGTNFQSPIRDWLQILTPYQVDQELRYKAPYVYTTIGDQIQRVRIRLEFPSGLFEMSGSTTKPHKVDFWIRHRETGTQVWSSPLTPAVNIAKRGKFHWSIDVWLTKPAQWDIQVQRITPAATSNIVSKSTWSSVTEQSFASAGQPLRHPNLALLSLQLRATERIQGSSPRITVPCWGKMISAWDTGSGWRAPAFFDQTTLQWTGRNPAWVLADYLLAEEGLGRWITDDKLDLPSFKDWADWNEELVPDGKGGSHERNFCDLVMDAGRPAWEYVLDICRAGQAVPVLVGKKISIKFEHDDTISFPRKRQQAFTQANIEDFSIQWPGVRSKPNVLDAQILNEELDFEQDLISVEAPDAFGLNEPWRLNSEFVKRQSIKLFGVTRPEQARRILMFMHRSNFLWDHTVTFSVGVDALAVEIGDIVGVETDVARLFPDPTSGLRATQSGAGSNTITLDESLTLDASAYEIVITQDDSTVAVRTITSPGAGTYPAGTVITFSGTAISWKQGAVCAVGKLDAVLQDYMVMSVEMREDLRFLIQAIKWDAAAYLLPTNFAQGEGTDFGTHAIGSDAQPLAPVPASDIRVDMSEHGTLALVAWALPADLRGVSSRVYVREKSDLDPLAPNLPDIPGWNLVYEGPNTQTEIQALEPGAIYQVAVTVVTREGAAASPNDDDPLEFTAAEFPEISPRDPRVRYVAERAEGVEMAWDPTPHASTKHFEIRRGPTWGGGKRVLITESDHAWIRDVPYGAGQKYQVRAIHKNGLPSPLELPVTVNGGVPAGLTLSASMDPALDAGTVTGLTLAGSELELMDGFLTGSIVYNALDLTTQANRWWSVLVDSYEEEVGHLVGNANYECGSGEARWRDWNIREATEAVPGADFDWVVSDATENIEEEHLRWCGRYGGHGENTRAKVYVRFGDAVGVYTGWIDGEWVGYRDARYIQVKVEVDRIGFDYQRRLTQMIAAAAS